MIIFVIAGEVSGDVHGAHIVEELRKNVDVELYGTGGPMLKALGQKQYATVQDMAVIGFTEVIGKLRFLTKLAKTIEAEVQRVKPDLILMVDYPGFNLRLAKRLHKYAIPVSGANPQAIPIVQFSAPQVWVWHYSRVETLKAYFQKVLCLLPFEEDLLKKEGINAVYIGHPVVDSFRFHYDSREAFFDAHNIDKNMPLVGIVPGSRPREIKLLMPVIIEAAQKCDGVSFVLAKAPAIARETLEAYIPKSLEITIVEDETHDVMRFSDILWICSGTATLEAGIIGTPMILLYDSNVLNFIIMKRLTSLRMLGLPNIIAKPAGSTAGEFVIPEVVGKYFTAENLLARHREIMSDPQIWRDKLKPLAEVFVGRTPIKTAAEEILKSIKK